MLSSNIVVIDKPIDKQISRPNSMSSKGSKEKERERVSYCRRSGCFSRSANDLLVIVSYKFRNSRMRMEKK